MLRIAVLLAIVLSLAFSAPAWGAISLVGTPQGGQAIDNGDVTLTFDVAPQENDVVVVFGGPSIVGASGIVTSGYTNLTNDGLNSQAQTWYKVMGSTPDTDVVCDGGVDASNRDGVAYIAYVLRGVDTSSVPDATAVRVGSGGVSSNPDPGAIVTVTDGAWVFAFASAGTTDTSPGDLSAAGYVNQVTIVSSADTFDVAVTGMYKVISPAGSEDPPAYTGWNTAQWATNTVAIRPAAGGEVAAVTPTLMLLGVGP